MKCKHGFDRCGICHADGSWWEKFDSSDRPAGCPELLKKDREWRDYPIGTKAHAYNGGAWLKTERGWTWNGHTMFPGRTFQTPGADALGACVELPANTEVSSDE